MKQNLLADEKYAQKQTIHRHSWNFNRRNINNSQLKSAVGSHDVIMQQERSTRGSNEPSVT